MQHYYVNKQAQPNGEHEVHVPRCTYVAEGEDAVHLGTFVNCKEALQAAHAYYEKVNGCAWCCQDCHSR